MSFIVITLAGAVGAILRYLIAGWAQRISRSGSPVGTLLVNLVGAFLLGLMAGTGASDTALGQAVFGLLGGFTTFSTWMIETLRLGPQSRAAFANLTLTLVFGIALATLGFSLTS